MPKLADLKVKIFADGAAKADIVDLAKNSWIASSTTGGFGHEVYTMSPGIPGDSGNGYLTQNGEAVGVLSTLNLAPLPVSNGMTDLPKAVRYAEKHGFAGLELEPGTEPFTPKPAALLPRSLASRG